MWLIHCIYDFVKCAARTKCSRAAEKLSACGPRAKVWTTLF